MEEVPAADEQRHGRSLRSVRVLLADPPAFTPVRPRARGGARPRGSRGRARHVAVPLRRDARSGRLRAQRAASIRCRRGSSRPLAAAAAAEGGRAPDRAARRCGGARADVLHLQWLALPELDVHLRFRLAVASSPRTTCCRAGRPRRADLWRRLLARFDRVVVHSRARPRDARRARRRRAAARRPPPRLPERPGSARGRRRARCSRFGVIRPYKGLADAIEAMRRVGRRAAARRGRSARADGAVPRRAAGLDVDWRLGYLPQAEVDRALRRGDGRGVPVPAGARPERRAAAARSAPACRRSSTTSAASPSRCAGYGAGRVVPAGDVDALTAAVARAARRPATRSRRPAPARAARAPS